MISCSVPPVTHPKQLLISHQTYLFHGIFFQGRANQLIGLRYEIRAALLRFCMVHSRSCPAPNCTRLSTLTISNCTRLPTLDPPRPLTATLSAPKLYHILYTAALAHPRAACTAPEAAHDHTHFWFSQRIVSGSKFNIRDWPGRKVAFPTV